jgi:hypothetical protein
MTLTTTIDHMLDQLSDSMYEEQQTAPAIVEQGVGGLISPREYEMFCKRCHVMQDSHPSDTSCPVGQIEHKLYELRSKETN